MAKEKSTRIVFKYNNKYYKFIGFFVDKNDNSFYFHTYEEANQNFKMFDFLWKQNESTKIEFERFKEFDFVKNKLSFHESGFIHSTDKNGKRLKDGVKGIPFSKIDTSLLILIIGPKKIETLIEIDEPNKNRDLLIELPEVNPFTINIEVYRKSEANKLDINHANNIFGGYILFSQQNKEFGLRIYAQKVEGVPVWPPFTLTLTRIG